MSRVVSSLMAHVGASGPSPEPATRHELGRSTDGQESYACSEPRRASRRGPGFLPPLPPGEGRGEGPRVWRRPSVTPPHPNPLPEGEGTRRRPQGSGVVWLPLPPGEGRGEGLRVWRRLGNAPHPNPVSEQRAQA